MTEQAFNCLKAAPVCIASPDHPVPTSHFMTENYYPGPQEIVDAVLELVGVEKTSVGYQDLCSEIKRNGPHDTPNPDFTGPF